MKKVLTAVMTAAMAASLAACGSSSSAGTTTAAAAETTAAETTVAETATDASEDAETEAASGGNEEAAEGKVTLAAAASLEYAFSEKLIPAFEAANPGITVEGTYDSSGKLQTQIESGLDADIFFSAATKQMTALNDEGYVKTDSILNYLENKIVLIVPADSDSSLSSFEDIPNADMIAIGDPESVPVGQYSKEALTNLGIWDGIQDKISLGTNVTEVLNWVAEGSADCGIVYATDAATTDKVKVIAEAPEGSLATPVVYPVAMMTQTEDKDAAAAQKFFDYITSDEGFAVFSEYGFADYRGK
ncbi:MAG: molybdate ABC transporter substrate-binding protein [Eubacteriales bacterium]|nr:molybdate ABC transporter substrate-binding protein [Eubacteriales bacterium]